VLAVGNLITYYVRTDSVHEALYVSVPRTSQPRCWIRRSSRLPQFVLYALVLMVSLNRGQAATEALREQTAAEQDRSGGGIPLAHAQHYTGFEKSATGARAGDGKHLNSADARTSLDSKRDMNTFIGRENSKGA